MKFQIEKLTKLIPIVYPIIIFLGYYNYFAYYRFFDIEIFNYLSIYELLFSFISMIIPILITFFIGSLYLMYMIILPYFPNLKNEIKDLKNEDVNISKVQKRFNAIQEEKDKKKGISLIYNKSFQNLKRSVHLFIQKLKAKKYSRAFSHLSVSITSLISFSIKIFLWLFFILFTISAFDLMFLPTTEELKYYKPFFVSINTTFWYTLLWSIIISAIIYNAGKRFKKHFIKLVQIFSVIFIIFFSITIYQKIRAEKTINHLSKDITFKYNGKQIQSNSKLIYIGKTSKYLFLRNIENKTNYIYSNQNISNLEIKSNTIHNNQYKQ